MLETPENSPTPFSILDLPKVMPPPLALMLTGRLLPSSQVIVPVPLAVL